MSEQNYAIEIKIETAYIEQESAPTLDQYVFSYTITIHNVGFQGAKLLSRHWIIVNEEGKTFEIQGDGVVGEQPHIPAGDVYQYTSGVMLDSPVGTMQGSYQLVADDGQFFEATISPFALVVPNKLH